MKNLLYFLFVLIVLSGCSTNKRVPYRYEDNFSLNDEMNKSIIDGFYGGDTTGIGHKIYLLK
jgi:hypothetical protein